ncbi:thioesterase-like superfamily-domain-containing protein [Lipomyces arxii]|uniref:thioesterase-like superfamily-domain-containing protein n=1 Tax=Lipomyces arxii TaxID=56418 RepID=UPI0034CF8FC8
MSAENSPIEELLELEELDLDLFRSAQPLYKPKGARGLFGGNVISQSLMAAIRTVPTKYEVHSMHCYFVLAGDASFPILYKVEHVRDGRSYITRTVQARQKGRCIFTATISFQVPAETEMSHSPSFPKGVPVPEKVKDYAAAVKELFKAGALSKAEYDTAEEVNRAHPVDTKFVIKTYPDGTPAEDKSRWFWVRARGQIKNSHAHAMALAYFSDSSLLGTSPWVNNVKGTDISMMVSLDHTIYFHAPCKADEWLLYEMQSPWSGSQRGLVFARLYSQDGTLVASVIQEGVVRLRKRDSKSKL